MSGKIDKYEYLIGEEILPSDQGRIIEQAKFTYSPLGKTFEKQINLYHKTNEYIYNFRTINSFGGNIYNSTITLKEPNEDQRDLTEILNFRKQVKPKNPQ